MSERQTAIERIAEYQFANDNQRALAVSAALELINTSVASGKCSLNVELSSLSNYADLIEEVLGES